MEGMWRSKIKNVILQIVPRGRGLALGYHLGRELFLFYLFVLEQGLECEKLPEMLLCDI